MTQEITQPAAPGLLFKRVTVSARDQRIFIGKLVILVAMIVSGVLLALQDSWLPLVAGIVLLGAAYTHAVELQHQCLHHSAFVKPLPHRIVGVPLGLPLLVGYTHYRVRHLQHHRYLGTPMDSEFFGFDTRQPLTWRTLARGLFDYPRLFSVMQDIGRSARGTWQYGIGQISDKHRRSIIAEHLLLGALLIVVAAVCALGGGEYVLRLWLAPLLLVAVPLHFIVELPEHILCDTESTDVLVNTRSIRGSWFSTWFTNGNNLHIEHHAAMNVPINRLGERHLETEVFGKHVERSYPDFFRVVVREVAANSGR